MGIRIWVAQSVVRYVDNMITKSGSVVGAVIHCEMLILILSQLDRIISIFVVKREHESFTGCGVTARTWNENQSLTILSISVEKRNRHIQKPYCIRSSLEQNNYSNKNKYSARGSDLLAKALRVIYLGDAWIFKRMKWDRDFLGGNSFYSRKSVLVGARRMSKGEVWGLTERDHLSGSFWWFTTGPYGNNRILWKILLTQIHDSDLVELDATKFCSVSVIDKHLIGRLKKSACKLSSAMLVCVREKSWYTSLPCC